MFCMPRGAGCFTIVALPVAIISIVCLQTVTMTLALAPPYYSLSPSSSSSSSLWHHRRISTFVRHPYYDISKRRSSCPIRYRYQNPNRLIRRFVEVSSTSSSDNNNDGDEDEDAYDKNDISSKKAKPSVMGEVTNRIEDMVRATGLTDEKYKFGDFTRRAVSDVTRVSEDTVRTVTGNEQYQFGDITKNITVVAFNATEDTIRSFTGDKNYQFGDITKSVVSDVTDSAENWMLGTDVNVAFIVDLVSNVYHSLPSSGLFRRFLRELRQHHPDDASNDDYNNKSAMTTALQLIAFIGLTLHFVLNIFHSSNIIAAWGYTWWNMGVSPLHSQATWQAFLRVQHAIRIFLGPFLLPLQVGITFFLSLLYRDFVVLFLEQKVLSKIPWWGMRMKKRYPVLNRFLALFLAYFLGNGLMVAAFTGMGCFGVGAVYRLGMRLW